MEGEEWKPIEIIDVETVESVGESPEGASLEPYYGGEAEIPPGPLIEQMEDSDVEVLAEENVEQCHYEGDPAQGDLPPRTPTPPSASDDQPANQQDFLPPPLHHSSPRLDTSPTWQFLPSWHQALLEPQSQSPCPYCPPNPAYFRQQPCSCRDCSAPSPPAVFNVQPGSAPVTDPILLPSFPLLRSQYIENRLRLEREYLRHLLHLRRLNNQYVQTLNDPHDTSRWCSRCAFVRPGFQVERRRKE